MQLFEEREKIETLKRIRMNALTPRMRERENVCERERERERVCVCVCVRERENWQLVAQIEILSRNKK